MGGVLLGVEPVAVDPAPRSDQGLHRKAHPGGHGVGGLRGPVQEGDNSG